MKRRVLINYGVITLGSLLTAVGLDMFLVPNRIAAGGVSGLATVIYYVANFPVGVSMLVFNIPLFLGSVRILGPRFGLKTLYGFFVLSVFVDLLQPLLRSPTSDPLLAAVYGGGLTGIGLGLVFRSGGTTGGTDIAAQLIRHYFSISIGQALLIFDGFVIALAGVVFSAELALYALVSVFITSRVVDVVQEGMGYAKAAFIISDFSEAIARAVTTHLGRGATFLEGRGAFTLEEKGVLLAVVGRAEVTKLKNVVSEIDPRAFVIVSSVHEVLGEGFKEHEIPKK